MSQIILSEKTKAILVTLFPAHYFDENIIYNDTVCYDTAAAFLDLCVDFLKDPSRCKNHELNILFKRFSKKKSDPSLFYLQISGFRNEIGSGQVGFGPQSYQGIKLPINTAFLFYSDPVEFLGKVVFAVQYLDMLSELENKMDMVKENELSNIKLARKVKQDFFIWLGNSYGIDTTEHTSNMSLKNNQWN
jgi:hypothetical protein